MVPAAHTAGLHDSSAPKAGPAPDTAGGLHDSLPLQGGTTYRANKMFFTEYYMYASDEGPFPFSEERASWLIYEPNYR